MRSREAFHVCKLNQPIKDRFFCHVTIRLPKKIMSIGSSSHLFSLYKNVTFLQMIVFSTSIPSSITHNPCSGTRYANMYYFASKFFMLWYFFCSSVQVFVLSLKVKTLHSKLPLFFSGEMNRDDKGFADPERIQKLVKNYSQFVLFPIYTRSRKKKTKKIVEQYWEWELTNEALPSWLRDSKDVTTVKYNEFYRITLNTYMEPLTSPHFTTEIHGEGWCG
ncbi:unnamed protein product [Brassica rapa]|uniref:Uncharacterized protein n=1 Tax=Brassica campestris TaxID=3711 RepID=A0A8D9GQH0_BRACM|nr:unnamed protein product [Brassica rapa]